MTLTVEPISTLAVPGFFLNRSAEAFALVDEIAADNLRVQYDLYHMRVMGDDLAAVVEANLGRIGHMQLADVPGRHEPGTGTTDFPSLFRLFDRLGYRGWIGAEYVPAGKTGESLAWAKDYL
jgi:hydroxypyruvate isomerase